MKRSVFLWQLLGISVSFFGGTLLHFVYEWSGESIWAAPFSGVNESTWEHMKLLFFPSFLFALIQYFFFKDRKDFWDVKLKGILLGIFTIPALYYLYNGIIGISPAWLNICIFFISAAVSYIYEAKLLLSKEKDSSHPFLPLTALIAFGMLFVIFTFVPPDLNIFSVPSESIGQ